MRSWNYKLLCGAVCLAQLACLSLPVWAAQNSAAFTRQTTLQQLRDDPAIQSSGYYTYCRELSGLGNEYWKNKTLEQYMRPELVDDSVAAMNLVAENTRNGVQVTWQVYSPEEIAANSSLGCVQLYYFPGKEPGGKYALVVPGNGSTMTSEMEEGGSTAYQLHEQGYTVFVLRYRTCLSRPMPGSSVCSRKIMRWWAIPLADRSQESLQTRNGAMAPIRWKDPVHCCWVTRWWT